MDFPEMHLGSERASCKTLTKDGGDAGTRIRSLCRVRQEFKAKLHGNPRIAPSVFR